MELPFTRDQFLSVFVAYNRQFVVVAAALWIGCLGTLAAVWRNPPRSSRLLSLVLSAMWLWSGLVYHALLFTTINPAAWLFAALFVVQAGLFVWPAGARVEYFSSDRSMSIGGTVFIAYALAYPFLTLASGPRYPAMPTFGVPCPTDILTIGVLLTVRGHVPLTPAIIPLLWGFVGGSAAVLLSVPTDYVLLGAALLLTRRLIAQALQRRAAEG